MAEKAFAQIMETEKMARDLIKNAREEAARIVESAREEADAAFVSSSESLREKVSGKRRQAEADAAAASIAFLRETEAMCAELRQTLSARKLEAVKAVIQVISV